MTFDVFIESKKLYIAINDKQYLVLQKDKQWVISMSPGRHFNISDGLFFRNHVYPHDMAKLRQTLEDAIKNTVFKTFVEPLKIMIKSISKPSSELNVNLKLQYSTVTF